VDLRETRIAFCDCAHPYIVQWSLRGTVLEVRDAALASPYHNRVQIFCTTCGRPLVGGDLLLERPSQWSSADLAMAVADGLLARARELGICPLCYEYLSRGCADDCPLGAWSAASGGKSDCIHESP